MGSMKSGPHLKAAAFSCLRSRILSSAHVIRVLPLPLPGAAIMILGIVKSNAILRLPPAGRVTFAEQLLLRCCSVCQNTAALHFSFMAVLMWLARISGLYSSLPAATFISALARAAPEESKA